MSIKIDRFQTTNLTRGANIKLDTSFAVGIKDLQNNRLIAIINFEEFKERNTDLTDKIIDLIEDYIMEQKDEQD